MCTVGSSEFELLPTKCSTINKIDTKTSLEEAAFRNSKAMKQTNKTQTQGKSKSKRRKQKEKELKHTIQNQDLLRTLEFRAENFLSKFKEKEMKLQI